MNHRNLTALPLACLLTLLLTQPSHAGPPFSGTVFVDPDIITPSDPSAFVSVTYISQDLRSMYDVRIEVMKAVRAHRFDATFDDGRTIEIQVNPEVGSLDTCTVQAERFGFALGQLPAILRSKLEIVWVQDWQPSWRAGFAGWKTILVSVNGVRAGFLEETLAHEAAHVSLDHAHAVTSGCLAAQDADGEFISTYVQAGNAAAKTSPNPSFPTWPSVFGETGSATRPPARSWRPSPTASTTSTSNPSTCTRSSLRAPRSGRARGVRSRAIPEFARFFRPPV